MKLVLDIGNLKEHHSGFLRLHHGAIERSTDDASSAAYVQATAKQGFTHQTHNARKRTSVKVIRRGGKRVVIRLKNTAKYGAILEHGSRPHVIRAKTSRGLIFKSRQGWWVRKMKVNHPGTRAYRFLSRGQKKAFLTFKKEMAPRMSRAAKSF